MKAKIGDIFYGSEGILALGNWGTGVAMDRDGKVVKQFRPGRQAGVFRRRQPSYPELHRRREESEPSDLHAEIREGHLSAGLGHAATISYRLGKQASIDQVKKAIEAFGGDDDNAETLQRTVAHLKKPTVST